MNYLLNYGISEDVLENVVINNSEQTILDAEWNIERVVSSLDYLKEIGITEINNILLNRFDILLRGRKELEVKFNNLETKKIVDMINKDIQNVFYLD